jgi:hypothetical protein
LDRPNCGGLRRWLAPASLWLMELSSVPACCLGDGLDGASRKSFKFS